MYCVHCGHKLIMKETDKDGMIPYCEHCQEFRFPTFSSGISTVILSPDLSQVLFIQQYNRPSNILVAGYIMKGENAIETLKREVKEEVDLELSSYMFNDSKYFERTNTLMTNFISVASSTKFHIAKDEVDKAHWYPIEDALKEIRPNSLAKQFVETALPKIQEIKRRSI